MLDVRFLTSRISNDVWSSVGKWKKVTVTGRGPDQNYTQKHFQTSIFGSRNLAAKLPTSNADFNDEQWKCLEISKHRENAGSFLGCWLLILEKT